MTIKEAAANGISRLRKPEWTDPNDYMRIDLVSGGMCGPWGHLYSSLQPHISEPTPQDVPLIGDAGDSTWLAYEGPLHEQDSSPEGR